jgi:type IV pilus assembly protein PilC
MLIRMIHVGEKTNSLDDVLARCSAAFDAQLEASFTAFSSKIQPIMIAIMGLIVAAMFIAIYAPMLSIMGAL